MFFTPEQSRRMRATLMNEACVNLSDELRRKQKRAPIVDPKTDSALKPPQVSC